jgi:hypothetical protein
MRFRLKHVMSGKYAAPDGQWTNDQEKALGFESAVEAMNFRASKNLEWTVIDPPPALPPLYTPPVRKQ